MQERYHTTQCVRVGLRILYYVAFKPRSVQTIYSLFDDLIKIMLAAGDATTDEDPYELVAEIKRHSELNEQSTSATLGPPTTITSDTSGGGASSRGDSFQTAENKTFVGANEETAGERTAVLSAEGFNRDSK